jgi:hypothetical protein
VAMHTTRTCHFGNHRELIVHHLCERRIFLHTVISRLKPQVKVTSVGTFIQTKNLDLEVGGVLDYKRVALGGKINHGPTPRSRLFILIVGFFLLIYAVVFFKLSTIFRL